MINETIKRYLRDYGVTPPPPNYYLYTVFGTCQISRFSHPQNPECNKFEENK